MDLVMEYSTQCDNPDYSVMDSLFIQESAMNHEKIAEMFTNLATLRKPLNKPLVQLSLWSIFPPNFIEISCVFMNTRQPSNRQTQN